MIDDLEKANFLLEKLKAVVPLEARLSQSPIRLLAEKSPEMPIPERCKVIDVFYTGDEGGIICCLDIGGPQAQNAHLVSITHLSFYRNTPLSREIDVYQRHRIKKLKQQDGRGY
ncbi:MAG: putative protein YjbI, containings pentapeptide repeat [Rhodospirillales bacterium]|nr:putative protein YjbI, containings pentapeptide repeat [Rhodospirillales bacterium]